MHGSRLQIKIAFQIFYESNQPFIHEKYSRIPFWMHCSLWSSPTEGHIFIWSNNIMAIDLSTIIDKAMNLVAQYGPFPVGNLVGIWLSNIAFLRVSELEKERDKAQGESINHLTQLVQSQQERIDKLHDKLYPYGSKEGNT